jgi:very-short-patch-repair endonuclease
MRIKTMEITSKRDLARQLRRQQTLSEQKMWWLLRSRAFNGFKFCRQYLIGPFVTDFCCRKRKLVIELDGGQHAGQQEYDLERTCYLELQGYQVLRFWNRDFLNEQENVLKRILKALETCPHPPSGYPLSPDIRRGQDLPSPGTGEGGRRPDEGKRW